MRVAVVGATGNVGTSVLRSLADEPAATRSSGRQDPTTRPRLRSGGPCLPASRGSAGKAGRYPERAAARPGRPPRPDPDDVVGLTEDSSMSPPPSGAGAPGSSSGGRVRCACSRPVAAAGDVRLDLGEPHGLEVEVALGRHRRHAVDAHRGDLGQRLVSNSSHSGPSGETQWPVRTGPSIPSYSVARRRESVPRPPFAYPDDTPAAVDPSYPDRPPSRRSGNDEPEAHRPFTLQCHEAAGANLESTS